jgi:hypothetical protein
MATNVPRLKLDGMASKDGTKVAQQFVRAGVTIYPHTGDAVFGSRKTKARKFNWKKDETEGTVLSCNTVKTLGAPSGTWQATIKLRPDSDLDIKGGDIMDGDWADITYMRNGIVFPVMRGVVEGVRERKVSAGGATVRVFTVTGKDHGRPFETPISWQSIWVQTLGELIRGIMTDKVKGVIGGSPDEMFKVLIEAAFERGELSAVGRTGPQLPQENTNRSSWQLPPALAKIASLTSSTKPYFIEALDIDTDDTRGAYYNEVQLWTQAGQTLHQTLQQWCNPILNELWYDLRESTGTLGGMPKSPEMVAYIRERPFVNTINGLQSDWYSLDTITLPNWVIQDYDIGRDGSQRFTLFEVLADFGFGNPQEAAALAAPIWSRDAIQTHGIRPWQQNVRYVAKDGTAQGEWVNERKIWQRLLADWYGCNPYLGNGSLGAGILVPEAKVGMRVKYDTGAEKTSEHYYLEGVENKYTFTRAGHSGKTGLTVTRGWPGSDKDYLDMVTKAGKNYTEVF